jgi:hypothetical protein
MYFNFLCGVPPCASVPTVVKDFDNKGTTNYDRLQ